MLSVTARIFLLLCVLCKASAEKDSTEWQPPHINKQATTSTMYIKRRDVITLPCEASGNPEPSYKWIHNGRDLNMTKYIQQTPGHGTIIITIYGEQQDGYYQCFATNTFGTSVSNIVRMRWAFIRPFQKRAPLTTIIAPGKSIYLFDIPPWSIPPGEVQWLRISPDGTEENVTDLFPGEVIIDAYEGGLNFRSLSKKHGNVGSPYVCAITNTVLGKRVLGREFTLQIEGTEAAPEERTTKMYTSPSEMLVLQGDTYTMQCIFGGNPLPVVKWRKYVGELPSKHILSNNSSTLIIPNFQKSDSLSGYECDASNGISTAYWTFRPIYVERPSWRFRPGSLALFEGDTATFRCFAHGVPDPFHTWYINGVKVEDVRDPRFYQIPRVPIKKTNYYELKIVNITTALNMNIQCNATNKYGYVFADVYLAVNSNQTSGANTWTDYRMTIFLMAAFTLQVVI